MTGQKHIVDIIKRLNHTINYYRTCESKFLKQNLQPFIHSFIHHLFIFKVKTITSKYNQIRLTKTDKTLRNNVAYYPL